MISDRTKKINELYVEEYQYKDNKLCMADRYNLFGGLSHRRYFFKHDNEGYLHSYTSQELIGSEIVNKEYCEIVYFIDQKRKV